MKRTFLCIGTLLIALTVISTVVRVRAQQRQQMGGRPGEFHFILKEQADHNRIQFREMQGRIARMKADVMAASTDEATRARMLQNVDQFSLFTASMEAQLTVPVGQTAADVEQRLNYSKGQLACGFCHSGTTSRGPY